MSEKFGRGIRKAEGDELFKRYIKIKQRSMPKLKEALKGDSEALRYYCGREKVKTEEGGKVKWKTVDGVNEDWAFVFSKETLEGVMQMMKSHGANGVFIFHGARSAKDSIPLGEDGMPIKGAKATDKNGAPTLMIFPMSHKEIDAKSPNAANELEFVIHSEPKQPKNSKGPKKSVGAALAAENAKSSSTGIQHPGTGGGEIKKGEPIELPKGFTAGQYH